MYAAVENNSGNVPAFLVKLWTLVEDPSTDELIHWDASGTSFHVYDQQRFSREILPLYFKHNNIASFIRQLNMYGFRKVTHIDQGGLKIEKDDLQFQHQYFQRGEQDMLQYIKRKVSTQAVRTTDHLAAAKTDEVSRVLADVKQVKTKQESTEQNLEYIKRENKLLWREIATLRQKHHKQQQIVNKLIQFLVSLVSSNRTGLTIPTIRRVPLAINDASQLAPQTLIIAGQTTEEAQGDLATDETKPQIITSSSPSETIEGITDDVAYKIESPKIGDFLLSPSPSTGGPIIHELTESPQNVLVPATSIGLTTSVTPVLTTSNVVFIPTMSAQPTSTVVGSQGEGVAGFLMSPKIEVAPSLEDALNFGLNVPSSSAITSFVSSPPQPGNTVTQNKRKRKVTGSVSSDLGVSPTKRVSSQPKATASNRSPMSAAQTVSFNNLVQAHSDLNSSGNGDASAGTSDASLALAASRDNDDLTLSSDQLDLLSSDLDGLKGILQEQYKVDPAFLMEILNMFDKSLFDSSNPWPLIPDKDFDEMKADHHSKDEAGTSESYGNITGTELVEYNPRDDLFPELMEDNIIGDIDDID